MKPALCALLGLAALMFSGCASTAVDRSWAAKDFGGIKFRKMAVVAATTEISLRRTAEDIMREAIVPMPSQTGYMLLGPNDDRRNSERLLAAMSAAGADGLVILKFFAPPNDRGTSGPVQDLVGAQISLPDFYQPDPPPKEWFLSRFRKEKRVVIVQTNLYAAASGRLLWSGSTETKNHGSNEAVLEQLEPVLREHFSRMNLSL